jgi:hypothetical protein
MRTRDLEVLQEILDTRDGFGHREHLELAWRYLGRWNATPLCSTVI